MPKVENIFETVSWKQKLESDLPCKRDTYLVCMSVLSSSLTTASTYGITYIHIEMSCMSLRRHKLCCPSSSAEDIILCVNLMLQMLCSHVVKDYILKRVQELPGCFIFFVTFVGFFGLGLCIYSIFFSSGCTAVKNTEKKRFTCWKIKENVQMRKDKYQ